MRTKLTFALLLGCLTIFLATAAAAGDEAKTVTVEGKMACAKCTLGMEDAKDCQNVLVVEKGDDTMYYYLVKNDVAEEFGHACHGYKAATVTGTVEEKDGKTWLTATKMTAPKEA